MLSVAVMVALMQVFTYTSFAGVLSLEQFHFDKILHFGAGVSCGIFGCYLSAVLGDKENNQRIIFSALATALAIGVLWEIFEHLWPEVNGGTHDYFSLDTKLDIIFDCTGGLIASLFYKTKNIK